MRGRLASGFAGLLLLDVVLVLVMLGTDKNLQTDFGATAPYYLHWYGVLLLGVVTLVLAVLILVTGRRSRSMGGMTSMGRTALVGGALWSFLAIGAMVGILATYQQVGFSSAGQFAQYLFGVSAYPGALSYIPWLYDLLLGMFLVSAVVGVAAVVQDRKGAPPGSPDRSVAESSSREPM